MFESSIKHKQLWIDSFFIFALIWAFGSLLSSEGKILFDKWLKGCFDQREKDIAASLRRSAEEKIQELTRQLSMKSKEKSSLEVVHES